MPIDPATLIKVGGSLLGGLLGRSKPKYQIPPYGEIRRQAEAAGFNPLFALANAPGQGFMSANPMGAAISDAALMLGTDMQDAREDELRAENEKLRKQLQEATIRPIVGGLYARNERIPSLVTGKGGASGDLPKEVSDALGSVPLPDTTLDRSVPAYVGGMLLEGPPGWTSPAVMEDEVFGDNPLLAWPYGLAWTGAAAKHNYERLVVGQDGAPDGSRLYVDDLRRSIEEEKERANRVRERRKVNPMMTGPQYPDALPYIGW